MLAGGSLEAAAKKAKKAKRGIGRVLGLDKIVCDCGRCRGKQSHRPPRVEEHRLLYGLDKRAQKYGENAPRDNRSAGPSNLRTLRGASRQPSAPRSPIPNYRTPLSPVPPNIPNAGDALDSDSDAGGFDFPADLLPAAPAESHPPDAHMSELVDISDDSMDDLPARRIYTTNAAIREPTRDWTPSRFLPSVRNPNYDRDWGVGVIRPDLSSSYAPPDPVTWEDTDLLEAQWERLVYRPVSPVPSFDEGPVPLYPVVPLSRPTSPGISDSELDDELRDVAHGEDRRFYEEMLGDNPPLGDFAPAPLDFDGDPGPGDNPGDDSANEDGDGLAAEGPDSELGVNEPAPIRRDDPGDEPEDPYAGLGAAFEQPGRLRNIYIRTWVKSVFGGSTRQQTTRMLASHRIALEDAADEGTLSEELLECLPTMAQTHRSLERRLGVNSDEHLKIYALCQGCGKRYSMHAIDHARLPGCPRILPETGLPRGYPVWEEKELYGGVKKRVPLKCYPFFPPAPSIERILSRPGIRELLTKRAHGNEDDPPLTRQHWMRTRFAQGKVLVAIALALPHAQSRLFHIFALAFATLLPTVLILITLAACV